MGKGKCYQNMEDGKSPLKLQLGRYLKVMLINFPTVTLSGPLSVTITVPGGPGGPVNPVSPWKEIGEIEQLQAVWFYCLK